MERNPIPVLTVQTTPYEDQRPTGGGGLRRPTGLFESQRNYLPNFVQSLLSSVDLRDRQGCTMVVGSDGRYFSKTAIEIVVQMAAANGIGRLVIGQNGILSTPAVSCIIRKIKAAGGIILTASHSPGGPGGEFGVKFEVANGGSLFCLISDRTREAVALCLSGITIQISRTLYFYFVMLLIVFCINFFLVEIVDSVDIYLNLLRNIFDFNAIRNLLTGPNQIKIRIDAMNGGMNLRYYQDQNMSSLVLFCFFFNSIYCSSKRRNQNFSCLFQDRYMILGQNGFFVNASDSLAIIAANLSCIPYFCQMGVRGFGRSMPTSTALDKSNTTPGGWVFFVFLNWSDHLREKDGLWAVLVWLSILAARKQSVEEIVRDHWAKFGRHYYCRFDYEALEPRTAYFIMRDLEALITDKSFSHQQFAVGSSIYSVERTDSFEYIDPVDGTVTKRQGLRIVFSDASRLIFRMSASSHVRATLRIYAESYEKDPSQHNKEPQAVLSPLIAIALKISQIHERTGRKGPTVIT
uniref:Phosphoglucomutase 5 n=1 Tax=Pavo cristatus TaxID=9049 RepID=A0A8C9FNM4_PAVCR